LPVDDVGQAAFEAAQRFLGGLALEPLALVVATPGRVGLAQLGDGHHVQRVIQPPVPGAGKAVADLLAGRHVDGRGAVVGGEVMPRREPVDGLDLGQDPAGDQWADAIQVGQVRARGIDQRSDLRTDGFHLCVQRADVIQVLAGKLQAHRTDRVDRAQLGQQLLGPARLEPTTCPARGELDQ
jgi:hypothetical protein